MVNLENNLSSCHVQTMEIKISFFRQFSLIFSVHFWPLLILTITKTCPCNIQKIFSEAKIANFIETNWIFLLKTLIVGTRGGSNEYPQSMFWSKNTKNRYILANPSLTI